MPLPQTAVLVSFRDASSEAFVPSKAFFTVPDQVILGVNKTGVRQCKNMCEKTSVSKTETIHLCRCDRCFHLCRRDRCFHLSRCDRCFHLCRYGS